MATARLARQVASLLIILREQQTARRSRRKSLRPEVVTHVLGTFCYRCLRAGHRAKGGGAGGIRTLDRALQPYNGLANRRLQPLGHSSIEADMPDAGASRKRQIPGCLIQSHLATPGLLIEALRCILKPAPRIVTRASQMRHG